MKKLGIADAAKPLALRAADASKIGVNELVAAGLCTRKEFEATYASETAFRIELAVRLFEDGREEVFKATAGTAPGCEQLTAGFIAYLDFNLARPAMQQLAHAIQYSVEGLDLLQRMELGSSMVAQSDIKAMGGSHPVERARMLTTLAVATVRAEYKARKKLPAMREVLLDFCKKSGK